jgi:homoserine O-succinyltransferase
MMMFYKDFDVLKNEKFDGMIITGAPIEHLEFEDVGYWDEITRVFEWADTHVTSTMYICWAAQAGLYYHYGVPKHQLPKKKFGVFRQFPLTPQIPLFRGFDDSFNMPRANTPLMTCRYCLRYAMGFCVKRGGKQPTWKEPLFLESTDGRQVRLTFNCAKCQMEIYATD